MCVWVGRQAGRVVFLRLVFGEGLGFACCLRGICVSTHERAVAPNHCSSSSAPASGVHTAPRSSCAAHASAGLWGSETRMWMCRCWGSGGCSQHALCFANCFLPHIAACPILCRLFVVFVVVRSWCGLAGQGSDFVSLCDCWMTRPQCILRVACWPSDLPSCIPLSRACDSWAFGHRLTGRCPEGEMVLCVSTRKKPCCHHSVRRVYSRGPCAAVGARGQSCLLLARCTTVTL